MSMCLGRRGIESLFLAHLMEGESEVVWLALSVQYWIPTRFCRMLNWTGLDIQGVFGVRDGRLATLIA